MRTKGAKVIEHAVQTHSKIQLYKKRKNPTEPPLKLAFHTASQNRTAQEKSEIRKFFCAHENQKESLRNTGASANPPPKSVHS